MTVSSGSSSPSMTDSTDVFDFVVKQGNGIKALIDGYAGGCLKTLPRHYVLPEEDRIRTDAATETTPLGSGSIPVIDVSEWEEDPRVEEAITEAAIKWGMFQIVNHGVAAEVTRKVLEGARRFFDLPVEERKRYLGANSGSETVRMVTSFNPQVEKVLEWRDVLTMLYVDDLHVSAFWPPVCREEAKDYIKKVEVVAKKLIQVLMKRINVNEIGEETEDKLMGNKRINFNYYPPCPNPHHTIAIGRHSDASTITVLLQDDTGGLYVRGEGDEWIHVPSIDGALVVNIGDVLQIMSNDLYKSVEHRAVANRNKSRISIPLFVIPAPDALIGPLPQVLENGNEPLYKHVVYSDYFKLFFGMPHDGKNTIQFAKI